MDSSPSHLSDDPAVSAAPRVPDAALKLAIARVATWLAGLGPATLVGAGVLVAVLVVTYWSSMAMLANRWWRDADQVHGFLVPVVAGVILWIRREMVTGLVPRGSLWGLCLLGVAGVMRWASAYFFFALLDPLSLVPLLAGIVLFVGGWRALRWAAPAIGLLVFMVPLPGFAAGLLSHQLQRVGTIVSTYALQTVGTPAVSQGNVILLSEAQLGVVEACSGIRMMMLFFAVCFAYAFLVKRPLVDRALILVSAMPIAVLANVARIVTTGVLHELVSHKAADTLFHDLAGWFMMPLAVVMLWGEMALWDRLLIAPRPAARAEAAPAVAALAAGPRKKATRVRNRAASSAPNAKTGSSGKPAGKKSP
jgi:exosortase